MRGKESWKKAGVFIFLTNVLALITGDQYDGIVTLCIIFGLIWLMGERVQSVREEEYYSLGRFKYTRDTRFERDDMIDDLMYAIIVGLGASLSLMLF